GARGARLQSDARDQHCWRRADDGGRQGVERGQARPPRPHIDAMIATTSQSSRQERLRGTNYSDSPIPARLSRLLLAPGGQIALSHGQDPKATFLIRASKELSSASGVAA